MITHVTIENFKSHRKTDLDLGRLTLIVGPNSSGKSSVLEAINHLYWLTRVPPDGVFSGWTSLERVARKSAHGMLRAAIVMKHPETLEQVSFGFAAHLYRRGRSGRVSVDEPELTYEVSEAPRGTVRNDLDLPREVSIALGEVKFLRFSGRELALPSPSRFSSATLVYYREEIANLAKWERTNDERLKHLLMALKRVFPAFEHLRARRARVPTRISPRETRPGYELVFDFAGAKGIRAHLVSQGILIAFGILIATISAESQHVFLIDDIDRALDPRAQVELVTILKELLREKPGLQIVATTHSPYLLDAVEAKDVWVMALDDEGTTACRRLSDHPRAQKALEVLTTGEFYSSEDPRWVTRGG